MKLITATDVGFEEITQDGADRCRIREILTARDGAPTFAMRQFEVDPGGHTMFHSHAWEHEVYILEGAGEVRTAAGPVRVSPGDAVLVEPDEVHCFANPGPGVLRFLCLIPVEEPCCR